jgi:transitional endoplasmic reticulum ATPase
MKKRKRRAHQVSYTAPTSQEKSYLDLLALWTLRILVRTPIQHRFFKSEGFEDDNIMETVGLEAVEPYDMTKKSMMAIFNKQLIHFEKRVASKKCTLVRNIEALSKTLSLNPCERDILAIAVGASTEQVLQDVFEYLGEISKPVLKQVLCRILEYSPAVIQNALDRNSILVSSGFLKVTNFKDSFQDKLEVLDGLGDMLFQQSIQPDEIFNHFFSMSEPPELRLKQFSHVETDISLLSSFLKATLKNKVKGVNVLIYGLPGTGKTQFVKSLAQTINTSLYEINVKDSDGEPLSGQARFSAYQLCQKILNNSSSLILFDEIEDVFPDPTFSFLLPEKDTNKGWTNQILETNPNPAFWLCNSINQIDAAYKRRFDYVMEMKIPPMSVREQIIKESLDGLDIDSGWIKHLSGNDQISPALLRQSVNVTRLIKSEKAVNTQNTIKHIINNKLNMMGISKKIEPQSSESIEYSLEYLNPNTNLTELVEGVSRSGRGRICLYGHSGTGKTAFAHYLAKRINKPIIQKRPSDLLSKWVGETEKEIALMFEQGKDENGVLLLDEADSFIRDRQLSKTSWEVTMTNEILVQLEQYQGLFICSTNLMDNLDKASLRRFDFKVSFDYLTPIQSWKLFQQVISEFDSQIDDHDLPKFRQQVQILNNLTPGDFTLIKRRSIITELEMSNEMLLEELKEESRMKSGQKQRVIGFCS